MRTVDDTASLPAPDPGWLLWLDGVAAPAIAGTVLLAALAFMTGLWWMARRQAEHYRAEMLRIGRARTLEDRRCGCGRYPMMAHLQLRDGWGTHEALGCMEADHDRA